MSLRVPSPHILTKPGPRQWRHAGREHFYTPYVGTLVGATIMPAVSPVPKKALSQVDLREVAL